LVIGNSKYLSTPLLNPANDAIGMTALLRDAGFQVDSLLDANQQSLRVAVEQFGKHIRDDNVKLAIFYYAGHGVQLDWRNYLIPVDARVRSAEDVRKQSVEVSDLLRYMQQSKNKSFLVVLDACRDNPFSGTYDPLAKGLSQFDAPVGSMIAFATSPGQVAMDGDGKNGLYTSHLLREFSVRNARIEDAFKRVRLNVRVESGGKQIPWESTSLEEDLYLFPSVNKKLSEADQEAQFDREVKAWFQVKSSTLIEPLVRFLREFPSGNTSELAQARLNRLLLAQTKAEADRLEQQRIAELKAQEARAQEAAAAAARLEQQRIAELKAQELKIQEAKAEADRLEQQRIAELKAQEARAQEAAAAAARLEQQRIAELKAQELKVQEAKAEAARLEQQKVERAQAALQQQRILEAKAREDQLRSEKEAQERILAQERNAHIQRDAQLKLEAQAKMETQLAVEREEQRKREELRLLALAETARAEAAKTLALAAAAVKAAVKAVVEVREPLPAAMLALASTPYYKGMDMHMRHYTVGDEYGMRVVDMFNKSEKPLVFKVTRVDLAEDRVEYNEGEYVSDLMGNIAKNARGSLDAPRQFYPSELYLGKKWRTHFRQSRPNGKIFTFDYEVKVVAKEKITVPAGTFEAYLLEAMGFNVELGASIRRQIWVTPGVNADIAHETIVRLRNGAIDQWDRQELVSYKAAVSVLATK
jgi:hypothetical protein